MVSSPSSYESFLTLWCDGIYSRHYRICDDRCDDSAFDVVEGDRSCSFYSVRVVFGEDTQVPKVEFFGGCDSRGYVYDDVVKDGGCYV